MAKKYRRKYFFILKICIYFAALNTDFLEEFNGLFHIKIIQIFTMEENKKYYCQLKGFKGVDYVLLID